MRKSRAAVRDGILPRSGLWPYSAPDAEPLRPGADIEPAGPGGGRSGAHRTVVATEAEAP
jgi:hypothetical protein